MQISKTPFAQNLVTFLRNSPTPFHAVQTMADALLGAGFERLEEKASWSLQPGQKYFTTRNDSSIVAFVYGKEDPVTSGIRMVGAHTDSPCLKVKPNPERNQHGYFQLGVEVYGGVLLAPWFDRDLSLAGRISYQNQAGQIKNALIDFQRAIAIIPSVAIHLDRDQNEKRNINKQKELPPILSQLKAKESLDFKDIILSQLKEQGITDADSILDYELSFYDVQAPGFVGLNEEFFASARLDNLLSCFIGLQSLLESDGQVSSLLVCNDHEEVGSASSSGAMGPMLKSVLERWVGTGEDFARAIDQSMMISADNAHGIHPNFAHLHDQQHGPKLNAGPVIKINANQRYASNSETQAVFRQLCEQSDVPVQAFVTRSDMGCGSTIGPITATGLGVKTLDIGVPTFGMHSIRELAGSHDAEMLYKVLANFMNLKSAPGVN